MMWTRLWSSWKNLEKKCEDPLQDYDPNYFIDKAIEITKGGGVDGN